MISLTYGTLQSYRISVCQHRGLLWMPMQGEHPSEAEIGTVLCFPLVGCCCFAFLPHATRLRKCVLRLLTGDISIRFLCKVMVQNTTVLQARVMWRTHRCHREGSLGGLHYVPDDLVRRGRGIRGEVDQSPGCDRKQKVHSGLLT